MSGAEPPAWLPPTFRALRHRNYRLYFFGQVVSLIGTWVQTAVLMWLVWELTELEYWPPLISAANVLPTLLLGVAGGTLADRWPKRPLIILTQSALLVLSLALAGFAIGGRSDPPGRLVSMTPHTDLAGPLALLGASLLVGIVNALDTPARLAFVIDMVGRDDLLNAVALNSLVFNIARMIGPALAGMLLPALGYGGCFLVNAASFAAVLAALAAMRLPPVTEPLAPKQHGTTADALRLLCQRPGLMLVLLMGGSLAFFGWPLLSLLPAVSSRSLDSGSGGYAWMNSAVGAGALVGALCVATFCTPARRPWFLAAGILAGIVSLTGVALSASLPAAVGWCALNGCGLILFFATGQATLQLGAGEHNRGRIMGVWLTVLSGAQPLGNLASGCLAHLRGVTDVLLLDAGGIAAVALAVGVLALLFWRPEPTP